MDLDKLIIDYLRQKNTDFAIMINGEWGCGKTYCVEHQLSNTIKLIDCEPAKKKYEPVLISLYGISSIEDFYYKIFLGLNGWAKSKWFGMAGSVISKMAGAFGVNIGKEDFGKFTSIDSNHVLIFDDIERISADKISYKEILGLINSYTEQEHRKVIIVCNETEIRKNDVADDVYRSYKEKTIRFTYDFYVDAESVFENLLAMVGNCDYASFLSSNQKVILQLGGKKNYRTLKFIFDILLKIYSIPYGSYRERLTYILLVSTLIYAMEYKNAISFEQLKSLKQIDEFSFNSLDWLNRHSSLEDDKDKKKSVAQLMTEKYGVFFVNDMQRFPMLVDYITTGYLDEQKLKERLNELAIDFQRQEETPEMKVYNRLKSFHTMEDNLVITYIDKMIEYVRDGNYSIYEIMYVYALLLKYDYWHIERFELKNEIDEIFKNALLNKASKHQYNPDFDMRIPIWDNSDKESTAAKKYNYLRKLAININQQSYKHNAQEQIAQLLQFAELENIEELRKFRQCENVVDLLAAMDWERVFKIIENSSNPVVYEFIMCLEYLLRYDYHIQMIDMSSLRDWLDAYITSDSDYHIRKMYVMELKSVLEETYRQ